MEPQKSNTKNIALIALLGVFLIAILGYLYFNHNLKKAPLITEPTPATTEETNPFADAPVNPQAQVSITKDGFVPASITIKVGSQITFTNTDNLAHRVASDPHPSHTDLAGFDSEENLNNNDSFSYTFDQAGIYTYHDHLNPDQFKGTVIVVE